MAPACDVAAICRNKGGTSIWTAIEHQIVNAEDATSSATYPFSRAATMWLTFRAKFSPRNKNLMWTKYVFENGTMTN